MIFLSHRFFCGNLRRQGREVVFNEHLLWAGDHSRYISHSITSFAVSALVIVQFLNSVLTPESLPATEDGLSAICFHMWVFPVSIACLFN